MSSELRGRRRSATALVKLRASLSELPLQLLEPPRNLQRPPAVTEVPADLTHDGRYGEGHKRAALIGIETIDRIDQANRSSLAEVVILLAAIAETSCHVLGERQRP